jgi:hypothetical protein
MEDLAAGHRLFARHGRFALVELEELDQPSAAPTFTISSWPGGVHWLKLSGELRPCWAAWLSLGLAAVGVDVLRGRAKRAPGRSWIAELQLRAVEGGADPRSIDFASLAADRPAAAVPVDIGLDSYYVDGSPDSGPSLFLEVRAPDRAGFLGSLLDRLAGLSLLPDEMTIDTRSGRVCDRFQLKTAEGRLPPEESRRALVTVLDGLVSRPGLGGVASSPPSLPEER